MEVVGDGDSGVGGDGRGHARVRGPLVLEGHDGDSGLGGGGRGHAGVRGPLVLEGHDSDRGEAGAVVAMLVGVDHSWWWGPTAIMA